MKINGHDFDVFGRGEYDPDQPTIAAYLPGEAEGAYPNGERVIKTLSEEGDGTSIGTYGTVLSSHAIPDEAEQPEGMPEKVKFFYFVKWDDFPFPVGMVDWKIGKADAL